MGVKGANIKQGPIVLYIQYFLTLFFIHLTLLNIYLID